MHTLLLPSSILNKVFSISNVSLLTIWLPTVSQVGFETEFILLDPRKKGVEAEDGSYSYPAPVNSSTYASTASVNDQAKGVEQCSKEKQGTLSCDR